MTNATKQRFTHYDLFDGEVDLLVGDVTGCPDCHVLLFRDHAFISDGIDPDVLTESTTPWGHIAMGREQLPDDSEPVDPGAQYCESCTIERGII